MTTGASAGKKVRIKRGDGGSPEAFTNIAEVTSIGEFRISKDMLEATHLESAMREFIYGLKSGGQLPIECNFLPTDATQNAVAGLIAPPSTCSSNSAALAPAAS